MSDLTAEKADLQGKIERLTAFIETPDYRDLHQTDQDLLLQQRHAMLEYVGILGLRIERAG